MILAIVGGQSKIANDSDELTNELHELRTELAKSSDKMDGKLAQLNATISGKKLYRHNTGVYVYEEDSSLLFLLTI